MYVVYFVLLLASGIVPSFTFRKHPKLQKLVATILPTLVIFIFSAFKSINVGIDTAAYYQYYNDTLVNGADASQIFTQFEFGFAFIMNVFASLGLNYYFFSAFVYLVIYVPLAIVIYKTSEMPSIALIFYSCIGLFTFNLSGLRQGMAISLCLLAIYLMTRKNVLSMLCSLALIFVAFTFHNSALVSLVGYPLLLFKNYKGWFKYTIVLLLSFFILVPAIFQGIYFLFNFNVYGAIFREDVGEIFFLYLLLYIICFLLFSGLLKRPNKLRTITDKYESPFSKFSNIFYKAGINDDSHNAFYLMIFSFAAFFESLSRISYSNNRLALFFLPFAAILIPNSLLKIKSSVIRTLSFILLIGAMVFFFWYTILRTNYLQTVPFEFFF